MWNDRQGDRFVCHILDVETGEKRTLPHPFYAVSPDGHVAVAPDFRRINDMRPGYGYAGLPDPYADLLAPPDSGIFRLDLDSQQRYQYLYLYHVASGTKVPLGRFCAPEPYAGEWRCDLHPRSSPDGRSVVIDSAHGGEGRQLYLIDIGDIIDS